MSDAEDDYHGNGWRTSRDVYGNAIVEYDEPKQGEEIRAVELPPQAVRAAPQRGAPIAIERQSSKPKLGSKTLQELKYILDDLWLAEQAMFDARVSYVVIDNYGTVNRTNIATRIEEVGRAINRRRSSLLVGESEQIDVVVSDLRKQDYVFNRKYDEVDISCHQEENNVNKGILDPDFYRRQAALHLQTAEKLDGMPMVDPFENGQILSFQKGFGGQQTYDYAAIKTEVGWFVTGDNQQNKVFSYGDMLNFIGISQFETIMVVTKGEKIKSWWVVRQEAKQLTEKQSEVDNAKAKQYAEGTVVE